MQEETDPQENSSFSNIRYTDLPLIRINSFKSQYDQSADLKDIELQKLDIWNDYHDIIQIVNGCEQDKKILNLQQESNNIIPGKPFYCQDCLEETCICFLHSRCQQCFLEQCNCSIVCSSCLKEPCTCSPEKLQKEKRKFQNKSYCRYILLYVFRTIENQQYSEIIRDICCKFQIEYNNFQEYYRKQRILIMGYQALKQELIYDKDSIPVQNRKKAFKEVLYWYLNKLATKHILQSKKQDFREYIKFKNYVMFYYIHNPKTWNGNKPTWN